MNTHHTPGPWHVEPGTNHFHIKAPDWYVARTGNDTREAQANARLIAAAPELLEALQTILMIIDHTNPAWKDMRAVSKAQEVITKATQP